MSTKKSKPYRVPGAKDHVATQREAEAAAARKRRKDRQMAWLTILAVLILVVLLSVASWFGMSKLAKKPSSGGTAPETSSASASASTGLAFAAVTVGDGKGLKIGAADAANVVTVYSDFACEHCAEFETTYGQTLATLRDSGKIAIEYWPLGFGSAGSARASNAVACAAERDPKFAVNMYDGFFANMGKTWSNDEIMSMSSQLQPTLPDGYEACVTAGTHTSWVTGIYELAKGGSASGGTPAVYINGKAFDLKTGSAELLQAAVA